MDAARYRLCPRRRKIYNGHGIDAAFPFTVAPCDISGRPMSDARTVVLIPARLASTRLDRKPLADIAGAPMIVHVWRRAMEADVGPVIVACDDPAIADTVSEVGGEAVLTRADHASGSDRIFEALQRRDPDGRWDTVINLQGDLPTVDRATVRAVLTPLAVDPGHPFPFISNLSVSLGVKLQVPEGKGPLFARVKVPDLLPPDQIGAAVADFVKGLG